MRKIRAKKILIIVVTVLLAEILTLVFLFCTNNIKDHHEGWVLYNGKICYCNGHGDVNVGLCKIGNSYYYFSETDSDRGRLFRDGYIVLGEDPYFFNKNGKAAHKGWVSDKDGAKYYCLGNGKLKTGWMSLDDAAYYFYKNGEKKGVKAGEQAKDYDFSNCIYIPKSGCIDGDQGKALSYGIKELDQDGWTLEAAYNYAGHFSYSGRYDRYDYSIHKCALQGFEHQTGNCLVWMGSFCTMARLMGYDCQVVWGFILHKGEEVPHSWTEIREGSEIFVYDPRKANGKHMRGFRIKYGQPGAYKYVESKKTYLKW